MHPRIAQRRREVKARMFTKARSRFKERLHALNEGYLGALKGVNISSPDTDTVNSSEDKKD